MLSNNSNDPQPSKVSDPKDAGSTPTPVLDPNSPIETASGTGTPNDPLGTDNKPPGAWDGGDSLA